jgi:hypothetical protein
MRNEKNVFHCCSKRSVEIEAENVIPCDICYEKGVSCLHAKVIDDKYYTACKYEKDWIMEKYPLLVEAAYSTFEEPDNQQVGEAVPDTRWVCMFAESAAPQVIPMKKGRSIRLCTVFLRSIYRSIKMT